jgi:DNA polymerase-3 subunit gamma/tau
VQPEALQYIAKVADGSMRDGLSLLDQCIAFYLNQELTYEKVLEVLGAVDQGVYQELADALFQRDTIAGLQKIEKMINEGRDLSQIVSDLLWYLRNLMLIQASGDATDIVDASKEQLAVYQRQAKEVETSVLMRHIQVLSELLNQMRYAAQKRVLLELGWIQLCKPQMDSQQDMTTLSMRLGELESQIEQWKKEGIPSAQPILAASGENTGKIEDPDAVNAEEVHYPEAVPDDIRHVIENWDQLLKRLQPVLQGILPKANRTLGSEGELLLQFTNEADIEFLNSGSEHPQIDDLKEVIRQVLHVEVNIRLVLVSKKEKNRTGDIGKLFPKLQADIVEEETSG